MNENNDGFVKVLFKFYNDALEEWTVETMWTEIVDLDKGYFRIENIPFYASFACDDIIFAEYDDDEEMLTYRELIKASDNSTIQIVLANKSTKTNNIRGNF